MKKVLVLALSAVIICASFVACSSSNNGEATTKKANEEAATSTTAVVPTSLEVTKDAKVKNGDAINLFKTCYSAKELGLDKVDDTYSFMVASDAFDIEGEKYVKVAANVMSQNEETTPEGKETYSLTPVGEFYVSFDGKKVLSKDLKTGEYKELENKVDQYQAKQKDADKKAETKAEKTTKK